MDGKTRKKLAGLVGLAGAAVSLTPTLVLGVNIRLDTIIGTFCAAVGAIAGGAVFAGFFGKQDGAGWLLALAGAGLSTGLGASIGGLELALLTDPAMAFTALLWAPLAIATLFLEMWQAAAVWAITFLAIHLAARRTRSGAAHENGNGGVRGFTP